MSILKLIKLSLEEDNIGKDITTDALIPKGLKAKAAIIAREDGILAGLTVARDVFKAVDKKIIYYKALADDGTKTRKGETVAKISGEARSILKAERVALNFLSHLSGIATLTNRLVNKVKGTGARIYDTRKTLPALRELEKYAVRCGGGHSHRMGLHDQVLIKDNHIKARGQKSEIRNLKQLINEARKKVGRNVKIEIEVKNLAELKDALAGRPDIIMLDNFTLPQIKKAMKIITPAAQHRRASANALWRTSQCPLIEISGGVNLSNIAAIARTGVDRISVGAITHSAPALDFSLEIYGEV